jgi:undecaprenyl-diphosphatase
MTIFQSILLGIIQGITEFLPISSSGHLVIVPYLFGWQISYPQAFIFDVLVQVATLVGVLAFFWRDIIDIIKALYKGLKIKQPFADPTSRLGWFLLLSTIPAGLAGIFIKDLVEKAFGSPVATAIFLFITAGLLISAEIIGKRDKQLLGITWLDALIIGLFQILAIFPGLSRSGSTIAAGMFRNLERPAAARYSFLMAVPIMFAAGLLASVDLIKLPNAFSILPIFIPGFIAAAVVGYLVIGWLIKFLTRYPLYVFAAYCVVVGLITLGTSIIIR